MSDTDTLSPADADAFRQRCRGFLQEHATGISTAARADDRGAAMMAAANRPQELRVHLKGALKNGCTPEEIREILLLVALYCGIPAANEAHRAAMDVLKEEGKV